LHESSVAAGRAPALSQVNAPGARAMPMRIAWPSGRPASSSAFAILIAFARTAGGRFFIETR